MKINTKLLLMTVLFTFLSFSRASLPVFAETMEDAWKVALSSNHQIQASQRNTFSSQLYLEAAKSARIPSLTLESGYTILNNAPAALISGAAIKELPTGEDKTLSYKAMISIPVFTGGRISEGIFSAGSGLNSAKQDEIKTVIDIKMRVADAYVAVLRSKHLVEVTGNSVESLSAHTRDVTHFFEQGMITKNDLLASQVALADARQRSFQAINNLNLSYAAYNRLLGRPLDNSVVIDDLSAGPVTLDLNDLTTRALSKRPELFSLSEQSRALQHQAAGLRSAIWPQIVVSGGYSYIQNKYQLYEDVWSANIGLKWEIFDGGIARNNANAVLQKAEALDSIRSDIASVISLQVRQTCLDIEETQKRIPVTSDALAQSEENLRVAKDRYREGVGTNTEVLDAETLRIRSYSNYYNAVYDAVIAKIRLQYAIGEL